MVYLTSPDMEYLYYVANASLTLRIVEYLHGFPQIPVSFVTVIHLLNGWIVNVKMKSSLNPQQDGDFQAFLNELGIPYEPPRRVYMAPESLLSGESPIDVMHTWHLSVISHGSPAQNEIEVFRQQVIKGLGYCPSTLA